jgi:hypothetical protein
VRSGEAGPSASLRDDKQKDRQLLGLLVERF